jgi:hypothetical protein
MEYSSWPPAPAATTDASQALVQDDDLLCGEGCTCPDCAYADECRREKEAELRCHIV